MGERKRSTLLAPELRELLQEGQVADLRTVLEDLHPNDAANILSGLDEHEIVEILSSMPLATERDLFSYFDPELQESIVLGSGRDRVRKLLAAMPSDERAEFFEEMEERVRSSLVPLLERAAREDLIRRESYDNDQVGSVLSTEHCALRATMSVTEAIAELRRQEPTRETIYYSYVVDPEGRLVGFVSLRALISARDSATVGELMKTEMVFTTPEADQEEAATLIREYDLLALPVVDGSGRLLGIVTHDDAADILEAEDTEDMEKMAGIASEAEDRLLYSEDTIWNQVRRRAPLVALLVIAFTGVALVVADQEAMLDGINSAAVIALLPMVLATGGMVGSQTSTLIVRALALKDVSHHGLLPILWKELRIGACLALLLGLIGFGEAWLLEFLDPENTAINLTACWAIAAALGVHVVTAALLGAAIPLSIDRLGLDPATAATPTFTTIADFLGAVIYCATLILLL